MKILSCKIENFLAISEGFIELDDRGLRAIQGVNNDDSSASSNGVGKSSIPDALTWCLYGVTARGVSGDAVVNKVIGQNTRIQTRLKDGDTYYHITRHRKHKEHKNALMVACMSAGSSTAVDLTKGTEKETQALINEIMGCSLDVFMAAIYAGQESMSDLPKMTDKQLKLLIEEAAGVERLETAYALALKKFNVAKGLLDTLCSTQDTYLKTLANVISNLNDTEISFNNFEKERDEKRKHNILIAELYGKDALIILNEVRSLDEPVLIEKMKNLDKILAGHSQKNKDLSYLAAALMTAEKFLATCGANYQNILRRLKEAKDKLDNSTTLVKQPCGACGKPGDEHDLETFKAHATLQVRQLITAAKLSKCELDVAVAEVNVAKKAHTDFLATIPDVSDISLDKSRIQNKLDKAVNLKAQIKDMVTKRNSAFEKSESVMTDANPFAATVDLLKNNLKKVETLLAEGEVKIAEATASVDLYEDVAKVFGPAGVRAHILDTVTPFLNDRTADYLSTLSDGNIHAVWSTLTTTAKGDLKEKFNIEVTNDKGGESFAALSGGEKRKVRLATMLALQDLVASRATKSIDLYLADEIDDALDPAGLERLMGVLDKKARERGTVLVISHNSLSDWIPDTITVVKTNGVSILENS